MTWKAKQWREPMRFLYKGWGITVWKWCDIWLPLFIVWFGGIRWHVGWEIFHNGVGLHIHFGRFMFYFCPIGRIGWWYKKGIVHLRIGKYEYKY